MNFTLTTATGELDLLGEIAGGGRYEQLLPYSDEVQAFGVTFLCIGLDRLIHIKRAAGRPKDLEAIAELQVIIEEEHSRQAGSSPHNRGELIKQAIANRLVIRFQYNGKERVVEPQTYGISTTGNELLRGYQPGGGGKLATSSQFRLFEVAKIANLTVTDEQFPGARPEHNPQDSAMTEIFATLPKPGST